MSKGYWLTRVQGLYATQKNTYQFDKLSRTVPRRGNNIHSKQYFIPEFECTEDYRAKNIPVEEDLDCDVLDELIQNVDFNQNDDDKLSKQLKQARLQKIKTDTKLQSQKLDQRKKLLFAQWSQKFFEAFSNHFGKLRNVLVDMHLSQQQANRFNQCLDNCMNNLQVNLDEIWTQFQEEKQDED